MCQRMRRGRKGLQDKSKFMDSSSHMEVREAEVSYTIRCWCPMHMCAAGMADLTAVSTAPKRKMFTSQE